MNKPAYTLLEILIVLMIIGVMLGLLIAGMTSFRTSIQLQQAADQSILGIKETFNYSNNNILPDTLNTDPTEIYGYALKQHNQNNISRSICFKPESTSWDCSFLPIPDEYLISDVLTSVRFEFIGCEEILIVNLSRDIKLGDGFGSYTDVGECRIKLSHTEDPEIFRTIIFYPDSNKYEVKYGDA